VTQDRIQSVILSIVNSKSKTFLSFCFSFLAGVAAVSIFGRPNIIYLLSCIFIQLFLLGVFWANKRVRFIACLLICFFAGSARYVVAFPTQLLPTGGQTLTGFVAADPDIRIGDARYIVQVHSSEFGARRVYLTTGLYPQYAYGDVVRVQCRLERPEPFDGFRYDMHLAKFGVFSVCRDPHIEKIGEGGGNPVMRSILSFKYHLSSIISLLWPEPHASFMAGLLYGYRGGLGEVQDAFNRTGVSHIVAISGFNITIIAVILMSVLTFFRLRRQRAFWAVCVGIIVFVILVGASPSVVRAAVMGLLALTAQQIGRLSRPIYLLVPAAAAMVALNPFILLWDAGFQLSFAATLGLLSFAPLLEQYFKKIGSETMAAIIATLPLLLYHFGRFSVVAPIVNILILSLIPWLMLVGVLSLISYLLSPTIGLIVAWVAWAGMEYILRVVAWFSALPFAAFEVSVSWWGVVFGYGMIFFLYRFLKKRMVLTHEAV
jgi:competence protein ComEC